MPNYLSLKHGQYHWYHFDRCLTDKDVQFLSQKFNFSHETLSSCKLQKTPRPKINITSSYTSFIFHIPFLPKNSANFSVSELNVFITKTVLVTVESRGNIYALNQFFESTKDSSSNAESRFKTGPAGLFTRLMLEIFGELEKHIDEQGIIIDRLHKEVFEKRLAKKFVETISVTRYNQIIAHNALERQSRIFDSYRGKESPLVNLDKTYASDWNKILEAINSFTFELESDMDHLEGLVKTFESLVTFRTNEVIKILTIFSVILLPLTLISGIFGMNFKYIPISFHPLGFFITVMWMCIIALVMAIVFKLKRWL